jgi:PIN domain nuclease of toxin-antitoxin system
LRFLFDTHAYLWWVLADRRFPDAVRKRLQDDRSRLHFSAASAWEMATKLRVGKLPEAQAVLSQLESALAEAGISPIGISVQHARVAGGFPADHRDPFDRIIAAQSQVEGLTLVTNDPAFAGFPVKTLW